MTTSVSVHEAKATLSQLLDRVAAGEEVAITRRGVEVARLVPADDGGARTLGMDRGRYRVPDDFDKPLPMEITTGFEP